MLKENNTLITQAHRVFDLSLTAIAFIGAYFIKLYLLPVSFRGLNIAPNYYIVLLMIIIIWYIIFNLLGLYVSFRKLSFYQIFWNMVKAVSVAMLVMTLCMYLLKITDVSRIMMGIFYLFDIGLLALCKGIIFKILTHYRKKGFNFRNILIIGSRERAKDIIDTIEDHLETGYRVLGCIDLDRSEVGEEVQKGIQVIGTLDDLKTILLERVVDELIFAMPLRKIEKAHKYMTIAEEIGVTVRIILDPQIFRPMQNPGIASVQFEEFLGHPAMALITTSRKYGELVIKGSFDYFFTIIALPLSLPLFLLIAFAIKLFSRGPVFFKQERCGLNGRKFMVYKFRTMSADAEESRHELETRNEADGPAFKITNDPRIIPYIGTFLRKAGLDELPQLINIFKGEMSLIGPRPLPSAEVEKCDLWQRRRLSMKPGLTCLWQTIPNRNQVSFKEWMNLDLKYIDNWSLGLDFKILLMTARVTVMGAGR